VARSGAFFSRGWFSFCWRFGQEGLDALTVGFQESTEFFGRWESDEVAGDEEFVVDPGGGELDGGTLMITAKDDADGRGVAIIHPVGFPPVEVEIHLPGIAVFERSDFQIDEDVATESAVVENEINVVVLPPHGDAFLPGLEAKPVAEFEEEGLEVAEECALKVGFEIFRALDQAGEFRDIGIADQVGDGFLRFLFSGTLDDGFFIGREAGALVE